MIDLIYKILLTIINKENQGYLSPTEFNLIANLVQNEIFRSYFEDENTDKNKQNRGLTNKGYSHLPFNQRQRITPFAKELSIGGSTSTLKTIFQVPEDCYFIEDEGVVSSPIGSGISQMKVITEVQRNSVFRLLGTEVAPTETFPVYEHVGNELHVYPPSLSQINVKYIRNPLAPMWTYFVLNTGDEMFDPSNPSFQDFELHESELSNIVLRMLVYFGINLRETEVMQIAEILKDKMNLKDNA